MEKAVEKAIQKTIRKRFVYNEDYDRLLISRKKDSDVMNGSVLVMNLVLDLNTEDRVVNIELKHASEYLESIGIDSNILNNLTNASFVFENHIDGYFIYLILEGDGRIERIPYNIFFGEDLEIKG